MLKVKRIISLAMILFVIAGCFGFLGEPSLAEESKGTVIYDVNNMPPFKDRTKDDVVEELLKAMNIQYGFAYDDYGIEDNSYYTKEPSLKKPYHPGELKQETLDLIEAWIQAYRWLVGVDPLVMHCEPNEDLQYGALVRNFEFSHHPRPSSKPADMDQATWDRGAYAPHNIIIMGLAPSAIVWGWINEGYDLYSKRWEAIGHRDALIRESVGGVQLGYSGRVGIGGYTYYPRKNSRGLISAFPSPGYMPNDLVSIGGVWQTSFDYDVISYSNPSDIKVTVTNLRTKKSYTCTTSNNKAEVDYNDRIRFVQPSDYNENLEYVDEYQIEIKGLIDKATNKPAIIRYTVKFFDDIQDELKKKPSIVKNYNVGYQKLAVSDVMKDKLEVLAGALPNEITVIARTDFSCKIPVVGKWTLDKKNKRFVAQVDTTKLPKHITDDNNILKEVYIPYEIKNETVSLRISDDIDAYSYAYSEEKRDGSYCYKGDTVTFDVDAYGNNSQVFQITKASCKKILDSATSKELDKEKSKSYRHYYKLKNVDTSYSGEFFSITSEGGTGYVSKTIEKLNVIVWKRIAGDNRYFTMYEIVREGNYKKNGTVVIATGAGFKDALSAAGLAGLYDAPIILTDGKNLSNEARWLLFELEPQRILVAGGEAAISKKVFNQLTQDSKWFVSGGKTATVKRIFGNTSSGTSAQLALAGEKKWKDGIAIIATNASFKDALSVAPFSYAKGYPILLADNGKSLSPDVINALKKLNIRSVIIVGGEMAVTPNVAAQLTKNGIAIKTRLAGSNGVETSAAIARWGLANDMKADRMGIATSQNYPDALAGAALCGKNKSVLLLADDKAMQNTSFAAEYKKSIYRGYVFGGKYAVGDKCFKALVDNAI